MKRVAHCMLAASLVLGCSRSKAPVTSADAAIATDAIPLGTSKLLVVNQAYAVTGTDLVVTNRGASMRSVLVDGDPNKEDHVFVVRVEVTSSGGAAQTLELAREPKLLHGYSFTADPEGFVFGREDGAVRVERVP